MLGNMLSRTCGHTRICSVNMKRCISSYVFCIKNYIETTESRSPAPLLLAATLPLPSYAHIFPSGQAAILFAGLMAVVTFDKHKLIALTNNRLVRGGGGIQQQLEWNRVSSTAIPTTHGASCRWLSISNVMYFHTISEVQVSTDSPPL
jgi:hypothetical protein